VGTDASPRESSPAIVWFRQDLRLEDNPALEAALARGGSVLPVYVLDDRGEGRWRAGGASRWWLHHALAALDASLRQRGAVLTLAQGDTATVLKRWIAETGATAVYWNRRYEPAIVARDKRLETALRAKGIEVRTFNSALLFEPGEIANREGKPFQVFTPFWRHCLTQPVAKPSRFRLMGVWPRSRRRPGSLRLAELRLLPHVTWDAGLRAAWKPGEAAAQARLKQFLRRSLDAYAEQRNPPACDGSSRLSPHLHFGEIGPRQLWAAVAARSRATGIFPPSNGARVFLAELGWREFGYHQLFHFPATPERPRREEFLRFPWARDPGRGALRAWQGGRTGYPIVDAGMRQLWRTGWMHNRVRMIVASFLVKHLRLPWMSGAAWFWDTLVDADLANNTLGWQWSAGCGADAAPYFRIFAPVLQGRRFDPRGDYVRRWVPELGSVPTQWIHAPWEASAAELNVLGIELGKTYPRPIVAHAAAREAALAAWKSMRGSQGGARSP
jgi:deoxyribodipyrimidine photo-lyase